MFIHISSLVPSGTWCVFKLTIKYGFPLVDMSSGKFIGYASFGNCIILLKLFMKDITKICWAYAHSNKLNVCKHSGYTFSLNRPHLFGSAWNNFMILHYKRSVLASPRQQNSPMASQPLFPIMAQFDYILWLCVYAFRLNLLYVLPNLITLNTSRYT